jgi:hypothetical protein
MHNEPLQKLEDSRQNPWNKGKLVGSKPPLRTKDVWSIRTDKRRPSVSLSSLNVKLRTDIVRSRPSESARSQDC